MPFIDHSGKLIDDPGGISLHVYTSDELVLTRGQLNNIVSRAGYPSNLLVDPGDLRPLHDSVITGETLIVSTGGKALTAGSYPNQRKGLLRCEDMVTCEVLVDSPFKIESVLGTGNDISVAFGEDGERYLRSARTLYALTLPPQACRVAEDTLRAISRTLCKEVKGVIWDFGDGCRFIPHTEV